MSDVVISFAIGLAAGAHAATWGMYKDAIYEGFTVRKYFRSIVLSSGIAIGVQLIANFDMTAASSVVVLFGLVYVIERAISECYKTFVRVEDQSKYFIPMQLAVRGKLVARRRQRLLAGAGYVAVTGAIVAGIHLLEVGAPGLHGWPVILVIGSVGGWISAIGGAWKDAPHEGFELFKFFRSPIVSLGYAVVLATLTHHYVYISMGALGYTVATLETYKTFFKPNVPRGKFQGKAIAFPEMVQKRHLFVPLFAGIWVLVLVSIGVALTQTHAGVL